MELIRRSGLGVEEHIAAGFRYLFQKMLRFAVEGQQALALEDVPTTDMKIGPRQGDQFTLPQAAGESCVDEREYADALTNVADALEPQQKLMDAILCYVGEQYDSSELYNILHDTLAMSDQDIVSLGFDLPQCHKHNEEISTKRPKERKSTSYER